MENKKKSFYFEDYTESELTDNNKFNLVKISLNRVTFLSFVFFSLLLIFSIKIIYLSLSSEKSFYSNNIKKDFVKKRRDIVDRHGSVLATNVILYDVGVRPKLLKEKEKKNLVKQTKRDEARIIKKEKKKSKQSVNINPGIESATTISTNFIKLVEKIKSKNIFRPYPDINDIPN